MKLLYPLQKQPPTVARLVTKFILGIRPEDIHDIDFQPPGIAPAQMEASVEVIEQMGNEMIIYLEEGGKNFIARTDPRTTARVGGRLGLVLNLDNMHIFDRTTELSLAYEHKQEEMLRQKEMA